MTRVTADADWVMTDPMELSASASRTGGGTHEDSDAIAGYLRQIGRVPLLTAD